MIELLWLIVPCLYYLISLFVYRFCDREIFDSKFNAIIFSLLWPVWVFIIILATGIILTGITILLCIAIIIALIPRKYIPEKIKTGIPLD